jgi:hypothetical protein
MRIKDILTELSFMGSTCTKDCSGHQAGFAWSQRNGNLPAATASNSFNNGTKLAAGRAGQRLHGGGKTKGILSPTVNAAKKRAARAAQRQQPTATEPQQPVKPV